MPANPLIYRVHKLVQVCGRTWKELIQEEFATVFRTGRRFATTKMQAVRRAGITRRSLSRPRPANSNSLARPVLRDAPEPVPPGTSSRPRRP